MQHCTIKTHTQVKIYVIPLTVGIWGCINPIHPLKDRPLPLPPFHGEVSAYHAFPTPNEN